MTLIQTRLLVKRRVLFAAVMRPKMNKTAILTCISCSFGLVLVSFLTMKGGTPSLSSYSYNLTEQRMPSVSTTTTTTTTMLFDNRTKDAVLNCITGEVVGMRPRHIDTVDVRQLRLSEHSELDQHRKAMFHAIFHKRVWGRNFNVAFSASGRTMITACIVLSRYTGVVLRWGRGGGNCPTPSQKNRSLAPSKSLVTAAVCSSKTSEQLYRGRFWRLEWLIW